MFALRKIESYIFYVKTFLHCVYVHVYACQRFGGQIPQNYPCHLRVYNICLSLGEKI